ncbi:Predicted ATPase of the ABC class [Brevinema andersonii]|uniref:Predicted ATPase of the ABC class n=1 Tax=Brevinema andersonii TaxID=34097 RepID=A0A1I1D887_BREAD|nr:ABC-ATPase domain-containing protein [Brevinema andersonii]SFB69298.1 Predicted ATPase of the ABC class [Brevinema andersonii]
MNNLETKLYRLNKCKYPLYKAILGKYQGQNFQFCVDSVQPDPFAPPSKIRVLIPFEMTHFSQDFISGTIKTEAFCDAIGRIFAENIRMYVKENRGSGNSGFCGIRYGKQKIIPSNAVIINNKNEIELKILAGLPGFGRNIAAKEACALLIHEIPKVIQSTFYSGNYFNYISEFISLYQRQEYLRAECKKKNLIAFIANGSLLARESSVSDKPMKNAIKFQSPKSLEQTLTLSDGFSITGMAIPKGITLIAGSGYHGKSTLLNALGHAIVNHIAGDGREFCFVDRDAVFLRAEDGRPIAGADISPFINNLPNNRSSKQFETNNASGSTSQAANLIEALEAGTRVFLIDEDVSATNFLIRDPRMSLLVNDTDETITPLTAAIPFLKQQEVSIIMVTGALGDFINLADHVIVAHDYQYQDATIQAREIAQRYPLTAVDFSEFKFSSNRKIMYNLSYDGKKNKPFLKSENSKILFGKKTIDLTLWPHLFDISQYETLGAILAYANDKGYFKEPIIKVWDLISKDIHQYGWDIFSTTSSESWRYIVATRPVDWHAALCRLRNLRTVIS